ncbi:VanZ family protein [Nocardioides marmoribigeumensis]|uniref:Glycopeptide antibiotics resistance protein n=1 Tax=Nocardioides marmoribigeumensis TaxID=433649 RepID=A0ABU2BTP4_9ACTN|nr:VanZ family protein [Nocardioides marmoribigeumensis]MDR7362003.1 glycopeptide antibiotics resistance protein [Nocardioides marmoribigeumensis]
MTPRWWHAALLVALVVEAAVTAWLVLNPSPAAPSRAVLEISGWLSGHGVPDALADGDVVEFVCNIALFVPTGATLRLLVPRVPWWAWFGAGFVVSGAIELLQWGFLDARSATWRDVWANTLGFGLGAVCTVVVEQVRRLRRRRRTNARLAAL